MHAHETASGVARAVVEEEQKEDVESPPRGQADPLKLQLVNVGLKNEYIKTRQGNVRCFPHCCKDGEGKEVHNERSFCGDSLVVLVLGRHFGKDLHMVGEFRPIDRESVFAVGAPFSPEPHLIQAKLVMHSEAWTKFSFNPPRKWEHRQSKSSVATSRSNGQYLGLHVFTSYCVLDGVVVGALDTSPFILTPIWKSTSSDTDEKTSVPDTGPKTSTLEAKPAPLPASSSSSETLAPQALPAVAVQQPQQFQGSRSSTNLFTMAFPLMTQVEAGNPAAQFGSGPLRIPAASGLSNSPFPAPSPLLYGTAPPQNVFGSSAVPVFPQPAPTVMMQHAYAYQQQQQQFQAFQQQQQQQLQAFQQQQQQQQQAFQLQQQQQFNRQVLQQQPFQPPPPPQQQGFMGGGAPFSASAASIPAGFPRPTGMFGSSSSALGGAPLLPGFAGGAMDSRQQVFGPLSAWSIEQQKAFYGTTTITAAQGSQESDTSSKKRSRPFG